MFISICVTSVRFYSFVNDLIFDPFAGSGTLGRAAINLGRNFFLTEKEIKFINRIKEELYKVNNLFNSKNNQPNFVDIKTFAELSKPQ
jgi:DNA modification methylase